jgi:ADP-heptose:LPS heptosyltransferase
MPLRGGSVMGEQVPRCGRGALSDLLRAERPALCFVSNIGDSILTLPALRALSQIFTAPITLICPKVAFDLCFHEVSHRHVDTTGLPLTGPHPLPGSAHRALDYEALASEIGAVDVFIDTLAWSSLSSIVIRPLVQHLSPATSIGFPTDYAYDIVLAKEECHSADLMFKLARLFDPSARIETYAQPVPIAPSVREKARSIRAAAPVGAKVLVVHADTDWAEKRWPITRWISVLDRFLSRHGDFVAWVVGMGHEELDVGRERDRVFPHLGLPLDLAMGLVATADLFVGIDSCMLHAADLARVPGVGLFGPTRAATWGFRFGPHRHIEMSTMADITVDAVLGAMDALAGKVLKPNRFHMMRHGHGRGLSCGEEWSG